MSMKGSDSIREKAQQLEKTLELSKMVPPPHQQVHYRPEQRDRVVEEETIVPDVAPGSVEQEGSKDATSREKSEEGYDNQAFVPETDIEMVSKTTSSSSPTSSKSSSKNVSKPQADEVIEIPNAKDLQTQTSAKETTKASTGVQCSPDFDLLADIRAHMQEVISNLGLQEQKNVHFVDQERQRREDHTPAHPNPEPPFRPILGGTAPPPDTDDEREEGGGPGDGNEGDDDDDRQKWSNPIEFLLSCVALSVGLGNVWRFPFTAYQNGGGAFLIPYLIVLILIGRPLYFMELVIGQFSSCNSVRVWNMVPAFRGVGYGQAIATTSVVTYYTYLIALAVYYLVSSLTSVLPWVVCDPDILVDNRTVCISSGDNTSLIIDLFRETNQIPFEEKITPISSAEQFFVYNVLKTKFDIDDGIGLPDWRLTICLAICYLMLFFTLWKGVASSGKVAYFTALFPYLILFILLGKGCTLDGSTDGILYFITPQWEKLYDPSVWYAAVTQSFFSLSVGFGSLITYSSYNHFSHNTYRDALIISLTDTMTSLLAGFTIFTILGNLAFELDLPIDQVIKDGAGLAFISYPRAIGQFGTAPQVFSVAFFLMLMTLGLGSSTGLMSSLIAIMKDKYPDVSSVKITAFFCIAGFLLGLVYVTPGGQHILTLVDFFGGGFIIFALAVLEVIAVNWIYGTKRLFRDIKFMLKIKVGIYWRFCWAFFTPVALAVILIYSVYNDFFTGKNAIEYGGNALPEKAIIAGWCLTAFACIQVPYWFVYAVFMQPGNTCEKKIKGTWKPNDDWGPAKASKRLDWMNEEAMVQIQEVLDQ